MALTSHVAAIRSPTLSAPTKSAPRWAASVSPLPRNSRLLTTETRTPSACSRAKAVGCGCHWWGSTWESQLMVSSSRSVPGIRALNPITPCSPGARAVPSEVRLVAVVEGTPAVARSVTDASEDR